MALVVDDDVAATTTLLATRRPATVSVPLAELDYTVNDVCSYKFQIINISIWHACCNQCSRKRVRQLKKRKKRTCSFTGHLITQPLITQLPEVSTGRSPTSNILLRSADTRNYMQRFRMDHTPGAGNWITVIAERSIWTRFDALRTKLLLTTFYDFLIRHFKKNVKVMFFWNLKRT